MDILHSDTNMLGGLLFNLLHNSVNIGINRLKSLKLRKSYAAGHPASFGRMEQVCRSELGGLQLNLIRNSILICCSTHVRLC